MSDVASKDENNVSSLLGVSSADGTSPIKVYASPTSHRLLVDGVGVTGPTGPTGPSAVSVANGVYSPVASITISGGIITAIATDVS